jgi:site-specific recombinase XerD
MSKKPRITEGKRRRRLWEWTELARQRDQVILALLRETDILPGELWSLRVMDYDRERLRLKPDGGRYIALNAFAARTLDEYLERLYASGGTDGASPLYPDEDGRPLTEEHCWALIRSDMKLADVLTRSSSPA